MERRNKILIIDDMEINRAILCELFQAEYTVLEAENGLEALHLVRENKSSIAVILLDIVMPVMDGFQMMERLQDEGILNRIPVILITADTFRNNEIKGLNLGASDIIMKPFDPHIVKKRVQNSVELYQHKNHLEDLVEHQTKKLTETNDFVVDALSTVIEYRNLESGQHIRRIRAFTRTLLEEMMRRHPDYHLTRRMIETVTSASAMHDIGKIAIPDSILLKPDKLSPAEFEIMKTHTTKGCEILRAFRRMEDKGYLRYCYNICRYHHERWNGDGYPDGLRGDQIPLCAQVVAMADVYDALTSTRVYKPSYDHETAMQMIENGECGSFSDRLMDCFRRVSDKFAEVGEAYKDGAESVDDAALDALLAQPLSRFEVEDPDPIANGLREASTALQKETLERDALINTIPGGVARLVVNDDFRILLASDGFYRLTGYTRTEYHSPPIDGNGVRLVIPDDVPALRATVANQIERGAPLFVEYRIRRKDGSIAWINVHGSPMEMEDGQGVVQAVFIDCTENKRTEQKLISLMNSVPGGIAQIRIGNELSLSFASDGYYQLCGCTRDQYHRLFPGELSMSVIHPEDRAAFKNKIRSLSLSGEHRFSTECRLVRLDGATSWQLVCGVLTEDESGAPCCQCVFTDITESRRVQDMLRMNEERYRIIVEQIQDVIFEWDIRSDTMYHSPMFESKFGYTMPVNRFFDEVVKTDLIFEADKRSIREFARQLLSGRPYAEQEYRFKTAAGDYVWCRIKATLIYDRDHKPLRAIGTISDVDEYKKENALLEAKAQTDLLTGLYNKMTMGNMIEEFLTHSGNGQRHALFIIDIDDFKSINDSFGHWEGDTILHDISGSIRERFRNEDILGRAGGDEFVVFLKNIPSRLLVEEKARSLNEAFRSFHTETGRPGISGSIGISLYPDDGASFSELFRNADKALYVSKRQGKDQFAFFQRSED